MVNNPNLKDDNSPVIQLRLEYERQNALFDAQMPIVQRFLEAQACQIAEAYTERAPRVRFTLPDRIIAAKGTQPLAVRQAVREQRVGGFSDRLARRDVHDTLRQRLTELEQSKRPCHCDRCESDPFCFSNSHGSQYAAIWQNRRIRLRPRKMTSRPSPSAMGRSRNLQLRLPQTRLQRKGMLRMAAATFRFPYVPAARRFYLPQWVAFGDKGEILVNTDKEAEAHIASMQHFLNVLFSARSLAPYMIADDEFEKKRYGMLGQLVNQGRALANYLTNEIINLINKRVDEQSLNRGLSLSLPYFDDQDLRIETYNFVVIPAGQDNVRPSICGTCST